MDEWADADGNTLPSSNPASFEYSSELKNLNGTDDIDYHCFDMLEIILKYQNKLIYQMTDDELIFMLFQLFKAA